MSDCAHATRLLLIKAAGLRFLAKIKCLEGQKRGQQRSDGPLSVGLAAAATGWPCDSFACICVPLPPPVFLH